MFQDSRGYWYRSVRSGSHVGREYIGRGEVADAIVWLEAHERQQDADKRRPQLEEEKRLAAASEAVSAVCVAAEATRRAHLQAAGYHQHARGHWRKRRQPMNEIATVSRVEEKPAPLAKMVLSEGLMHRAQKGDKAAIREFFGQIKDSPGEREVLEVFASMTKLARTSLITLRAEDAFRKAAFERRLDLMRDELAGPAPTPLELQLAERVTLCYFQVNTLEALYNNSIKGTFNVMESLQRQLDAAHRRHLSAVNALAQVRKLQLPNVQVNIGGHVNAAQLNGSA